MPTPTVSAPEASPPARLHAGLVWVAFVALSFFAALPGGLLTDASWYQTLQRPTWAPPPWLFGPVWTALYLMIATAGWLVWRAPATPARSLALRWFFVQLALNCAWTPVFFGARAMGVALGVIGALWLAIVLATRAAHRVRPAAAALLLPYLLWVSFAAALNAAIWWLNRSAG